MVANWPAPRHEHWRALLRARAIENQAYVIGVNRVGPAKDLPHAGGSAIIDPLGSGSPRAAPAERVLVAEVDPATVGRSGAISRSWPTAAELSAGTNRSRSQPIFVSRRPERR